MGVTFRLEGLQETVRNLGELPKATGRNVLRRVLTRAAEPVASLAASLAPHESGRLAFSIAVSSQLTRRHKAEQRNRASEAEIYIGPAGGNGALYYASAQEFGTIASAANPFMRPAWEAKKGETLELINVLLGIEVERAAGRLARKAARAAGG